MICPIPEKHGNVHCANCLTGSFLLKEGERCPDSVTLESLPLQKADVRKGRCISCGEPKKLPPAAKVQG